MHCRSWNVVMKFKITYACHSQWRHPIIIFSTFVRLRKKCFWDFFHANFKSGIKTWKILQVHFSCQFYIKKTWLWINQDINLAKKHSYKEKLFPTFLVTRPFLTKGIVFDLWRMINFWDEKKLTILSLSKGGIFLKKSIRIKKS